MFKEAGAWPVSILKFLFAHTGSLHPPNQAERFDLKTQGISQRLSPVSELPLACWPKTTAGNTRRLGAVFGRTDITEGVAVDPKP